MCDREMEEINMRLVYSRPVLKDLSQGSRIAFVRQFRMMSQDEVSDKLGLTGECKRRTMTRYERGNRNPKDDRTNQIAQILNVNINAIKKYDYKNPNDIIYTLMWLEELIPNYHINLMETPNVNKSQLLMIKKAISDWDMMRKKKNNKEISYSDYIEWKLNYEIY
jgi:transcriptional regulator with XRE-family HTH domain